MRARSPDLAAGIRRVKGVKKHGMRMGNWRPRNKASASLPGSTKAVSAANEIMLWLPSCWVRPPKSRGSWIGVRKPPATRRALGNRRYRGQGRQLRTVPVPTWVKAAVDTWLSPAGVTTGPIFRAINQAQRIGENGFSPRVIRGRLRPDARNAVWSMLLPTAFAQAPECGERQHRPRTRCIVNPVTATLGDLWGLI